MADFKHQGQRNDRPFQRDLPPGYLQSGYFNAEGVLFDDLIVKFPRMLAEDFAGNKMTTGQIRRFYHHLRRAGEVLKQGESFAAVRAMLLELKPLAADAVGRADRNKAGDYTLLSRFIETNVDEAVKSQKHLESGFIPHFQYVVAYFTYFKPKES